MKQRYLGLLALATLLVACGGSRESTLFDDIGSDQEASSASAAGGAASLSAGSTASPASLTTGTASSDGGGDGSTASTTSGTSTVTSTTSTSDSDSTAPAPGTTSTIGVTSTSGSSASSSSTGDSSSGAEDTSSSSAGGGSNTSNMAATTGVGELPLACAGVPYDDICWYLGDAGQSCQEVCADHGELAGGATNYVGSQAQGGSLAECESLLALLGVSLAPQEGYRPDGLGLGCHVFQGQGAWWLGSSNFSGSASLNQTQLVCGCSQ